MGNSNRFIMGANTNSNSNTNDDDLKSYNLGNTKSAEATWKHGDSAPPFEFIIIIRNNNNINGGGVINNVEVLDEEDDDAFFDSIPYARIPTTMKGKENDDDASTWISQITDDQTIPYARLLPDNWYEATMEEQFMEEMREITTNSSSEDDNHDDDDDDDSSNDHRRNSARLQAPPGVQFCYQLYDYEHLKVPGGLLPPVGDLLIRPPRRNTAPMVEEITGPMAGFLNQKPSFTF